MRYNPPFGSTDLNAPYVDRNTPGAVAGSKVPARAIEHTQREIVNAIALSGQTPDVADLEQLWKAIQAPPGRLINRQRFTTSGTYTPTEGTRSVVVEVQAAGGAGGGSSTTPAGNFASAGAGGAAGGYSTSYLTSGFSGQTVTVGARGLSVANNNGSVGGTGGSSSFGSLLSATGGVGGNTSGSAAVSATGSVPFGGANPGRGTGGNIFNSSGGLGRYALLFTLPCSGDGGGSKFGAGAHYVSSTAAGNDAFSPGSGGSGASTTGGQASGIRGGHGADGLVIVWEYA